MYVVVSMEFMIKMVAEDPEVSWVPIKSFYRFAYLQCEGVQGKAMNRIWMWERFVFNSP